MKIYTDYMTVNTTKQREFITITSNVKFAVEKSGFQDGIVLVTSLHSNSAVFVNDDEAGLQTDIETWLQQIAPFRADYKHATRTESNASVHLQALLLGQQVMLALTGGKLEMGPWQSIVFAELDGLRPKKIVIKILGE
ncbi:MAG: secondary thiamine-phosphate synthase enzyme YjbQ [Candidatus Acidiferrales bacterium]